MPPSGYDSSQACLIIDFLKSCADALKSEAKTKNVPIVAALTRELSDIESNIGNQKFTATQKSVLDITRQFYIALNKAHHIYEENYERAVKSVLKQVAEEITAIHL